MTGVDLMPGFLDLARLHSAELGAMADYRQKVRALPSGRDFLHLSLRNRFFGLKQSQLRVTKNCFVAQNAPRNTRCQEVPLTRRDRC